MAKTIEYKIDVDYGDADKSIKSLEDLKKELKSLEGELETTQIGTKRFDELSKQVRKARAEVKDIELQFEGLDKEQRAAALVDTFSGLAGAIGAVSGAFIAFGAESEAIENAEKKLLGVIAVVQGIREVSDAYVASIKLFGPALKNLGTSFKAAFTTANGAINSTKVALASLGIGLVILAVDQLIQNWDKLSAALGFAEDEQKKYNDALTEAEASIQGAVYDLNYYNSIVQDTTRSEGERLIALDALNKAGVQTEDINLSNVESLDLLNGRVRENIELIVAQTKAEAARQLLGDALKKQLEVENSTLEDNISFWEKAGNQILYGTSVYGQFGVQVANATTAAKNQQEALKEANAEVARATKTYEETLNKLIPLQAADAETKKQVRTELERRAKADKGAAQALADYDKKLAASAALEKEIADNRVLRLASERDRIRIALEQQYADQLSLLEETGKKETDAYVELLAQRDAQIAAEQAAYDAEAEQKAEEARKTRLEKEEADFDAASAARIQKIKDYAVLRFDAEMSAGEKAETARQIEQDIAIAETEEYYNKLIYLAQKNGEDTEMLEKAKAASVQQIRDTANEEDLTKQKEYRQQLVDMATDSALSLISTLGDLNSIYDKDSEEAAKKSFERQKALNIVETLISTYSAAQKAYASQFVPVPDPSSPARGAIAAALAVASGLAKVAIIKKQKFQSTGGGGSASRGTASGGGSINAPGGLLTAPQVGTPQGLFGTPGQTTTPTPTGGLVAENMNEQPLRAYVLAGDVSNGLEANAKINQRRKL